MANYFKMKNVDILAALEEKGMDAPYHENGNLNRKEAAEMLKAAEPIEDKEYARDHEKVMCVIHDDGDTMGKVPVFVSIGDASTGFVYEALIPRETEVEIPSFAYDYLDGRHSFEYVPREDPATGRMVTKKRKIKRFKMTELDRYMVE